VGCGAGFFNTAKTKGIHLAMKSAIVVAECISSHLKGPTASSAKIVRIDEQIRLSWAYSEMRDVRNFRQLFYSNIWWGMFFGWFSTNYTRGLYRFFYTIREKKEQIADHESYNDLAKSKRPEYPAPDGKLVFSIEENLERSGLRYKRS
jgi:flavin-dependent dehydrogenase